MRSLAPIIFACLWFSGVAAKDSCVDDWRLGAGLTCKVLALQAAHEEQMRALQKAHDDLDAASLFPAKTNPDAMVSAIGVAAATASLIARDQPKPPAYAPRFSPQWLA